MFTEIAVASPAMCPCRSSDTPTTSIIIVVIVIAAITVTTAVIATRDKSTPADKSKPPAAQRPLPTVPPIQFEIVRK